MRTLLHLPFLVASLAVAGCVVEEVPPEKNEAAPQAARNQPPAVDPAVAAERQRARAEAGEVRFVVDISDRTLRLFQGGRAVATHPVAVGMDEYPTPVGRWDFQRVDINPDWTPPDSPWAEEEEPKEPGDPENPMGRARLLFHQDYSIHGTDDRASLGTNQSHGSIRAANETVLQLAQILLKAGGVWEGDQWFQRMTANPREMHSIRLENPVQIEVVE